MTSSPVLPNDRLSQQPTTKERVVPLQVAILVGVHLASLGAIFYKSWESFFAFCIAHFIFGCLGMTLGHHRLFSHGNYEVVPWLRNVIATISTFCFQGGPIFWASAHRWHHAFTDHDGDPHSSQRGFFWSHMGWLFYQHPNLFHYRKARSQVKDLTDVPYLVFLERHAISLNLLVFLSSFCVACYFQRLDFFFWLMPLRIVTIWHTTWLINSYVHLGFPKFSTQKGSKPPEIINSIFVSLIFYGEGSHREHHLFPKNITHSGIWRALDTGYWVLRFLQYLGLVKLPAERRIEHYSASQLQ